MNVMVKALKDNGTFRLIACGLIYQLVWLVCVISASRAALVALAPLVTALLVLMQWYGWSALRRRALLVGSVALLIGLVVDTLITWTGFLEVSRTLVPWPFTPLWLLSLWAGFGVFIGMGLERLYGKPWLAALVGFVGGPLAYRAGVPFGAVMPGTPIWRSYLLLAVVWAVVFAFLIWLAARVSGQGVAVRRRRGGQGLSPGGRIRGWRVCGCLLTLVVSAAPMRAEALDGDYEAFESRLAWAKVSLELRGVGRLRRYLMNGCDIALYTSEAVAEADLMNTDQALALEFLYYRNIKGAQLAHAAEDVLLRNIGKELFEQFKPEIERMSQAYRDVAPGDRYRLSYVPGEGTALDYNGERQVLIPGDRFAGLYLQIWLGDDPLDQRLYEGMTKHLEGASAKEKDA